MKKSYDIVELLKPVRLTEAENESDSSNAAEVNPENTPVDNGSDSETKDDSKNNNDKNESETENTEENKEDKATNEEKATDNGGTPPADANKTKQEIANARNALINCSTEMDNLYKNNNFEGKYGAPMKKVHGDFTKFLWIGLGALVVGGLAFLVIKGIVSTKKALAQVPNAAKALSGDKTAIQGILGVSGEKANIPAGNSSATPDANAQPTQDASAQQPTDANGQATDPNAQNQAVPGSNPDQLTDEAPTIENTVQAQANAKPGDVIQRNDGSKYKLNQGDIDWAKNQTNAGKGAETVDQAKQEAGNGNELGQSGNNNNATQTPDNTANKDAQMHAQAEQQSQGDKNVENQIYNSLKAQDVAKQATTGANAPKANGGEGSISQTANDMQQAANENANNAQPNNAENATPTDNTANNAETPQANTNATASNGNNGANASGNNPQADTTAQGNANGNAQQPNQQQNANKDPNAVAQQMFKATQYNGYHNNTEKYQAAASVGQRYGVDFNYTDKLGSQWGRDPFTQQVYKAYMNLLQSRNNA